MRKKRRNKNKKIEQICQNCKLFNAKENVCAVVVIRDGEQFELQTLPQNKCHWIEEGIVDDIKQIRAWSDGKNGYLEY